MSEQNIKAQGVDPAEPTEPFIYKVGDGTLDGPGLRDPQYRVGTPEYEIRSSSDQFKAVHSKLFDYFGGVEPTVDFQGQQIKVRMPEDFRVFSDNIKSLLPPGKQSGDNAAWYTLNVLQPQTNHDARYLLGKIRPLVKAKLQESYDTGKYWSPADMSFDDVILGLKQSGADPFLVSRLIAEESEVNPRKLTDTYTYGKLKPMIDLLDPHARLGELVANDPYNHLFNKTGLARREAFLAFVNWRDKHSESFLRGVMQGVGTVIAEGGYAAGGFVEGAIGTLVAIGSEGEVLMESGKTVLSDAWITRSKEERIEAQDVLMRAHKLASQYGPEIAETLDPADPNSPAKFAAYLERRFGQFGDPEEVETFRRLSELKRMGAFRPQMSWERLANFGEGILNSIPSMVHLFNASPDPNSYFFRQEANAEELGPMGGDVFGFRSAYEAWYKGSKTYRDMTGAELDRNIDLYQENWRQLNEGDRSIIAKGYSALGMEGAAIEADQMMQEQRLIQAASLADPVLTVFGAMKLIGVGAKAAKAADVISQVRTGMQEVVNEASKAALVSLESKPIRNAVIQLRQKLEAALPGAQFTDEDIIGMALGNRKGNIFESAAAQKIRTEIGRGIAKNKNLTGRLKELQGMLDELPDNAAGIDQLRARPVGGAVVTAAGATTQAVGRGTNWLADFLDPQYQPNITGGFIRRGSYRAIKWTVSTAPGRIVGGAATGAIVGASIVDGDFLGAALAGAFGVGLGGGVGSVMNVVIRPEALRSFGMTLEQFGRMQKSLGKNTTGGLRYGDSLFIRSAMDFEAEAAKIVAMPGTELSDAQKALKMQHLDDARKFRELHRMGIEDSLRNTTRVIWEDGIISGSTGALLAKMNDSDATGAGAGMAIGFSSVLRGANRMYQMLPSSADKVSLLNPEQQRVVLGDVATIIDGIKDPTHRSNILRFIGEKATNSAEYIRRAEIFRDLWMSHRGNIEFVSGKNLEMQTILTSLPEDDARVIAKEASLIHPNDTQKAAAYAAARTEQMKAVRAAEIAITVKTAELDTQTAKLNAKMAESQAITAEIDKLEKQTEAEKATATEKEKRLTFQKLENLRSKKSRLDSEITLLNEEQTVIKGDLEKAKGEALNPTPMRPYETRFDSAGNSVRKVANAFYIVDGPQGGKTYVDIDSIDSLGAISEGWHALLADHAVGSIMPQMVDMMWGAGVTNRGKQYLAGGTKPRVGTIPEVTYAILDAYANSLEPQAAAKFKTDLDSALQAYSNSDGKDVSGLIDPTREALSWILASMDMRRMRGTTPRPGLSTPEGAAGAAAWTIDTTLSAPIGWGEIRKMVFGDRTFSASIETDLRTMFDPVYGAFARGTAESVVRQLQNAGMRFIAGGDGTVRGFFLNNKNEVIRNAVLDDFYNRVIAMTGGRGSARIRPVNLYDTQIPIEARIDFVRRNGMDWVLNETGTDFLSPTQVAEKSNQFTSNIENALASVPDAMKGLRLYVDENGSKFHTGIPSKQDVAAILAADIPQVIKDNLVQIMASLGQGESKIILNGEYNNVFSVNVDALTEARLRVGKDIPGKTEIRNIAPLGITIGEAVVYDAKGNPVKVPDPADPERKVNLKQKVVRVHAFDKDAFINSKQMAFTQGLYVLDENGKRQYLTDPNGKAYTPDYVQQLFGSDAEFMKAATKWMNAYYSSGPIDPFAAIPDRTNNPVSAEVLDPSNPARGAAMRDALRMIFKLESGKKRLGWVEDNRQTNTANGTVIRGTNFPITDMRLEAFGPLKNSGESMYLDQRGITSGQFVMSTKEWKKSPVLGGQKITLIHQTTNLTETNRNGIRYADIKEGQGFVKSIIVHPSLEGVRIFEVTADEKGTGKSYFAYTMGDGNVLLGPSRQGKEGNRSWKLEDTIKEVRKRLYKNEDTAWVEAALGDLRSENAKAVKERARPETLAEFFKQLEKAGEKELPKKDLAEIKAEAKIYKRIGDLTEVDYLSSATAFGEQLADFVGLRDKDAKTESSLVKKGVGILSDLKAKYPQIYKDAGIAGVKDIKTTKDLKREFDKFHKYASKRQESLDALVTGSGFATSMKAKLAEYRKKYPANWPESETVAENKDVTPAADTLDPKAAPDAPEMSAEEVAKLRSVRITEKGSIITIPEREVTAKYLYQKRYEEALLWHRNQQAELERLKAQTEAYNKERAEQEKLLEKEWNSRQRSIDKEGKRVAAEQKRDAAQQKKDEAARKREQEKIDRAFNVERNEQLRLLEQEWSARERYHRNIALEQARSDARRAREQQAIADRAAAVAEAARRKLIAEAERQQKRNEATLATEQALMDDILNSTDPVIAPGLLTTDINRLRVDIVRDATPTEGFNPLPTGAPIVGERLYPVFLTGVTFEGAGRRAAHNTAFLHYLYGEGMGRGKEIASKATLPKEFLIQKDILESRLWETENGNRLFVEYKRAQKEGGKDLRTYKVYGANGAVVLQTNNSLDAMKAIEALERRFVANYRGAAGGTPLGPVQQMQAASYLLEASSMTPADTRSRGGAYKKEMETGGIQGVERYLPMRKRQ